MIQNVQDILKAMNLTKDQSEFVERVGRFWESISGTRTAGRIVGWLMISEPDHQSSGDLVEALGVSTGSVSTQVRLLEKLGVVERVTFPADRSSYYRLPNRVWSRLLDEELDRIVEMRKLAEAASDLLPETRPERVTELRTVSEFFAGEWPALMERLFHHLRQERPQ
jgi:DNA-binding transcriptional regulator GbsR (MarR family)